MKPGELRRFNVSSRTGASGVAGLVFLVIEVDDDPTPSWVTFLATGACQRHWLYDFVLQHSEVLNERR
jgi:hypothetical protein